MVDLSQKYLKVKNRTSLWCFWRHFDGEDLGDKVVLKSPFKWKREKFYSIICLRISPVLTKDGPYTLIQLFEKTL